jgi:hypothetical protein
MLEIEVDGSTVIGMITAYRYVSQGTQHFLRVQDCWGGLGRAESIEEHFGAQGFNLEEYDNYDRTLNAELHEILPGKLIAMHCPKDMQDGQLFQDVLQSDSTFSHS